MSQPATRIDTRFSDPGSATTPWSQTRTALKAAELFWITTVRTDGRPGSVPCAAVRSSCR